MSATPSPTGEPYPFPYLTQPALENRLDSVKSIRSDVGLSGGDWDQLIEDIIAENSAWVHRIITQNGVQPSDYGGTGAFLQAWPEVRQAMVRLCRVSLHLIDQQGLESESAEDRSESYRPPEKIRANVRALLEGINPDSGGTGDGDGFRSTIL